MNGELDEIFNEAFTSDIPEPSPVRRMTRGEMAEKLEETLAIVASHFARNESPTMDDVNAQMKIMSGMMRQKKSIDGNKDD